MTSPFRSPGPPEADRDWKIASRPALALALAAAEAEAGPLAYDRAKAPAVEDAPEVVEASAGPEGRRAGALSTARHQAAHLLIGGL